MYRTAKSEFWFRILTTIRSHGGSRGVAGSPRDLWTAHRSTVPDCQRMASASARSARRSRRWSLKGRVKTCLLALGLTGDLGELSFFLVRGDGLARLVVVVGRPWPLLSSLGRPSFRPVRSLARLTAGTFVAVVSASANESPPRRRMSQPTRLACASLYPHQHQPRYRLLSSTRGSSTARSVTTAGEPAACEAWVSKRAPYVL